MTHSTSTNQERVSAMLPTAELIAKELAKAQSVDDFFGKEGIISTLFSTAIEDMLQTEITQHLGYERYSKNRKDKDVDNYRNGSRTKRLRTSAGDQVIKIPRDRDSTFTPQIIKKHESSSNEIEDKIIAMYGKGMTVSDIQEMLQDIYGIEVSPGLISQITNKVMELVEEWHNRPLQSVYVITYLDCVHTKNKAGWKDQDSGGI